MGIYSHHARILCTLCTERPRRISFESTPFHASPKISVDRAFQLIITQWNALHLKTLRENSTLTKHTSPVLTYSDTAVTRTIDTGTRSSFWKYTITLPTIAKKKSLRCTVNNILMTTAYTFKHHRIYKHHDNERTPVCFARRQIKCIKFAHNVY